MPRPPHTESRSTPSARAASKRLKPSANSPRLPEGVKTTRWVISSCPRKRASRGSRDVLSGKPSTAWTPAFAGVTHAMRGGRATRASRRFLAPVVLGQKRQAMRIVFFFQPLGCGLSFAFQGVPPGYGLAAPPFAKTTVLALRPCVHPRRVDGANETL